MFPHFLGIGAQKAGTTWLHEMLSMHAELWLPHVKELHYFDRKFPLAEPASGSSRRSQQSIISKYVSTRFRRLTPGHLMERLSFRRWRDLAWEFKYLYGARSDAWYESLFDDAGSRLAGEITPAYSVLDEQAIAHVHALMPNARLILLMRDPIDRAWSHAKMDLAKVAGRMSDSVTKDEYLSHFRSPESRRRGDYLRSVQRWLTRYPEKQLLVGFYDEIHDNPEELLARILRFLGASPIDAASLTLVRNRFNVGEDSAIPEELLRSLAALYVDDLAVLADQYGHFPRLWLTRCRQALDRARNIQ